MSTLTFPKAMERLQRMASSLTPDVAGCARLASDIAADPEAEALSTALAVYGAARLIEECSPLETGEVGGDRK